MTAQKAGIKSLSFRGAILTPRRTAVNVMRYKAQGDIIRVPLTLG
jgi:hypothetical protein